jgi:hypothetical protein
MRRDSGSAPCAAVLRVLNIESFCWPNSTNAEGR